MQRKAALPPYRVGPAKNRYPGDTVVVHDPPASNMVTQDAYGDDKGIKAPPGARGEYIERPAADPRGMPITPHQLKVDETNNYRREQIPPMFLPKGQAILAAEEEIDNEDEPRDDEQSKRITDQWKHLFQPRRPEEGGAIAPPAEPGGKPGLPGAQPAASSPAPIPLDRLNAPDFEVKSEVYSFTGTLNPGVDTTERLKFYNLDPLIQSPATTNQMLQDMGFKVEVFSFDPNRFKLPKLKMQGYEKDTVWIYDPEVEHGSFKDTEYTRAWRVFHEVGHGISEKFMHEKYGPSRREGRLGAEGTSMRGVPPKQIQVKVRPLTLAEAQRAVEWEDVAFRTQQMLLQMYGVSISPADFGKEYNVNIADALYRVLTGDFGDPGEYGYAPSDRPANLRGMLTFLEKQEQSLAAEQGRAPTRGIDLTTWRPVSDEELRRTIEERLRSRRSRAAKRAFSVYPVPNTPPALDQRLLLQIPRDVQERYNDLHRRVRQYIHSLKLNTLDMYDFPAEPPDKWVEEERENVQVDWGDDNAWAAYLGRLSHDDLADWIGLETFDNERVSALAPNLHAQYAAEAGDGGPSFSEWFRSRRPAVTDGDLLNYVKETAQAFPEHGLGKGYRGYWRRRNHEMVRDISTSRARERHDRYLRNVAYPNYVRPHLRDAFETVNRFRNDSLPLSEVVDALNHLPFEVEDNERVNGFRNDYDGMISEGMHALDLYREPVSRDDRLFGDMEFQGEKWVPVRRIEGNFSEGAAASPVPVPLYRYGDRYFLVHESDRRTISPEMLMIRAHVFAVQPGSSIVKQAGNWEQRAHALSAALREVESGADKEAVFVKYGREFGPGLRKAVSDYLYIQSFYKTSDGGGGPSGSSPGDSTCSTFTQQSPDNCGGCTFSSGTGGLEFGYGDGACLLTHLFLNAPEKGHGRSDPAAYDPEHTPVNPSVQKPIRTRRSDPKQM